MASPPIVDLASLPLDTVLAGPEVLDLSLKQVGRFRMLQGVLHADEATGVVVGYQDLTADDWWAADHVPGRPMFPGALQIEMAAQLATYDYCTFRYPGGPEEGIFVGFGGVENVRFRGQVPPGVRLHMVSKLLKCSRRMFRYHCQGYVDGTMVFEGDIIGILV